MKISYLICAAGKGTRTKEISGEIPKPLLKIRGMTLLEHSVRSLPLKRGDQVFVIGQKADDLKRLRNEFSVLFPPCEWHWLELSEFTAGQLQTAEKALDRVAPGNSLAIFNADSSFSAEGLREALEDPAWEGVIPCSVEPGDAWSFCAVEDGENPKSLRLTSIAEKRRISEWCSVGFYFFRDQELFRKLAREELSAPAKGEFFVSHLYERYLALGKPVRVWPLQGFKAMGSMEQIRTYWGLSLEQMKAEQRPS